MEDVKLFRIENGGILKSVTDGYKNSITFYVSTIPERDALTAIIGNTCLVSNSGIIYKKTSTGWNDIGTVFGYTGPAGPSGPATSWGNIPGTISNQTDLQSALNAKQNSLGFTPENSSNKGSANGYAPLDGTSKISSAYLPSYVDDVIEVANYASLPGIGETGKIYVTIDNNNEYRWSGSVYIKISDSLETVGSIGTLINGATEKTTPVDADMIGLMDSAGSNILKKLSWVNVKATLKSYFDTLYASLASSPVFIGGTIKAQSAGLGRLQLTNTTTGETFEAYIDGSTQVFNGPRKTQFYAGTTVSPQNYEVYSASFKVYDRTGAINTFYTHGDGGLEGPNNTISLINAYGAKALLTKEYGEGNLNAFQTSALKSATTTVSISGATAPTSGQVLTATSSTNATWQTSSGGGAVSDVIYLTRLLSTASNTVTYSHGLGKVPTSIKIEGQYYDNNGYGIVSFSGSYANSKNMCLWKGGVNASSIGNSQTHSIETYGIAGPEGTYGIIKNLTTTGFDIAWTLVSIDTFTLQMIATLTA